MREKQRTEDFKVPVSGSLGLLALGHVGLREWRKVRDAHRAEKKKSK